MKNIHLIPTDKPSRILFDKEENRLLPLQDSTVFMQYQDLVENQHIYITSDEEIKEGDWFIANNGVHKCIRVDNNTSCPFITLNSKKEEIGHFKTWRTRIILTTDQDLIKDGVQSIPDEFLEWFVKNPSCESVEIKKDNHLFCKHCNTLHSTYGDGVNCDVCRRESQPYLKTLAYKIIIPNEERERGVITTNT